MTKKLPDVRQTFFRCQKWSSLLPYLSHADFPDQALVVELYREGGIRGMELGSVMFSHEDPDTGEMFYPDLELVRLAIPRRTYTQSHLDYIVETVEKIIARTDEIGGYKFTYAPQFLKHFTARFKML